MDINHKHVAIFNKSLSDADQQRPACLLTLDALREAVAPFIEEYKSLERAYLVTAESLRVEQRKSLVLELAAKGQGLDDNDMPYDMPPAERTDIAKYSYKAASESFDKWFKGDKRRHDLAFMGCLPEVAQALACEALSKAHMAGAWCENNRLRTAEPTDEDPRAVYGDLAEALQKLAYVERRLAVAEEALGIIATYKPEVAPHEIAQNARNKMQFGCKPGDV